ncbi:pfs domain-containing protein [Colletotrichum kahawae]|uniref:Pfs domain-containing protein n=1 Tax=Colletotrichum kahawae TaxID=34407 RepID=A0AAD9YSG0_COLKA|nr:pfs domain-containing protein [Colletotrichum kahawae]
MLRRSPRLAVPDDDDPAFVYQGAHNDRLFKSSAPHYGIIASGNSVMKNSFCRDEISRQIDERCICLEMEAAGLMNTFPCLVIRGICDYADSHKNNQWQNYAAATAAAFSKELLQAIDAVDVSKSPNMKQIVDETNQGVQQLNNNKLLQDIMSWLSPCYLWETHNSTLENRQDGTGKWFLESNTYASWKENSKYSIWIHGKPGCGKTTVCSTIIDDVIHGSMHPSCLLVFLYFAATDNRRQSLDGAIRSLIGQLCSQSEDSRTELKALFSSHGNGARQPSTRSLCQAFESMVQCTGEIWMVLDALDECETGKGLRSQGVMPWVKELLESPLSIRLLLTCRGEHKTRLYLEGSTSSRMTLGDELVGEDIRAYVHETLSTRETFERWRRKGYESIQREVEENLVAKANGVFRWVALQLDSLQHCQDPATLRRELNALPDDLANTYAAILRKIPKRSEEQSIRLLQFLAFSERPLRVKEVVDLLAVDLKEKPMFNPNNRMPIPEEIAGYCSGLVVIGSALPQVQSSQFCPPYLSTW